jgi:hypothetical protein
VPTTGPGERLVAVRLDGRPAVLVLSAPVDGSRTARVYGCTRPGAPVASATVPAR